MLEYALHVFSLTMIDRDNINIKGNIVSFLDSKIKIKLEGSSYAI